MRKPKLASIEITWKPAWPLRLREERELLGYPAAASSPIVPALAITDCNYVSRTAWPKFSSQIPNP